MRQIISKRVNSPVARAGLGSIAGLAVLALAVAGCGNSASPSSQGSSSAGTAKAGGTFTILANSAFGVADPAQNYTLEEWQLPSGSGGRTRGHAAHG